MKHISAYREACANIELMRRRPHPPQGVVATQDCVGIAQPWLTKGTRSNPPTRRLFRFSFDFYLQYHISSVQLRSPRVTASRPLAKYVSICSSISFPFPFPVLFPFPFLIRYSYTIAYPVLNVGAVSQMRCRSNCVCICIKNKSEMNETHILLFPFDFGADRRWALCTVGCGCVRPSVCL